MGTAALAAANATSAGFGDEAAFLAAPAQSERRSESRTEPRTEPRLAARHELNSPGTPRGLATADLDDDGRDELLAVMDFPGELAIWGGLTSGLGGSRLPQSLAIGDFSLGPCIERAASAPPVVVLAGRGDEALRRVHMSPAESGEWQADSEIVELGARPRALAVGAWTDGGEPWTAVGLEGGEVRFFQGATPRGSLALGDELITCMTFLPVVGLLAVGCQAGPSLRWVAPGEQGFEELGAVELDWIPRALERHALAPGEAPRLCVAGGDLELWLVDPRTARDGASPLTADDPRRPIELQAGALPISLERSDVDGDGSIDLLVLHHGDGRLVILEEFDGRAPGRNRTLYGGPLPWDLAAGDFDGDGFEDLAIGDAAAGILSLYFGQEGGLRTHVDHAATPAPHSMAVGDLDGDGRPEVGLLSALEDRLVVVDAAGRIRADLRVPPESDALNLGDVDGDGALDAVLISAGDGGAAVAAVWGAGDGRLAPAESVARLPLEGKPFDAVTVDVDGDGDAEVIVSDAAGGKLWIVDHAGGRQLRVRAEQVVGSGAGPLCAVRGPAGQFVGVALGQRDAAQRFGLALLLPADRARPFELEQVGFLVLPRPPEDVVAADFDGDGRPDVAALMAGVSDNTPGSILVALSPRSEGEGFAMQAEMPTGPKPFHLAAGDLDGDGCAELFATSQYANRVTTWIGRPDRQRALRAGFNLGAHLGCMNIEVADMNGDGRLDVIVGNNHSADFSVLLSE